MDFSFLLFKDKFTKNRDLFVFLYRYLSGFIFLTLKGCGTSNQFEKFIEQIWERKTKAKMFNWLLEIYVQGYNKESDITEVIQKKKKKKILKAWKRSLRRLKKENRRRERENNELIFTFRRIILTSKVFIAIKKLRVMKGKKRSKK